MDNQEYRAKIEHYLYMWIEKIEESDKFLRKNTEILNECDVLAGKAHDWLEKSLANNFKLIFGAHCVLLAYMLTTGVLILLPFGQYFAELLKTHADIWAKVVLYLAVGAASIIYTFSAYGVSRLTSHVLKRYWPAYFKECKELREKRSELLKQSNAAMQSAREISYEAFKELHNGVRSLNIEATVDDIKTNGVTLN